MNLDFSDEQEQLRNQIRRFLADHGSTDALRKVVEGDAAYDTTLYQGLADLGVLGAAIPEAYGGVGLGHLELCVLGEELGRVLAPVPVASSIYLAAEALMLSADEAQKKAWLPKLAAGEAIGCFASPTENQRPTLELNSDRLSGSISPVSDGHHADIAILPAREGDDVSMVLVDLSETGISREALNSIDPSQCLSTLTFDNVHRRAARTLR